MSIADPASAGRLTAKAGEAPAIASLGPGRHRLDLHIPRDTWLFVPNALAPSGGWPLLVALHGAGGDAPHMLDMMAGAAERWGVLMLAPASRQSTWDVIASTYGPDVLSIDAALSRVFAGFPVDPARIAVGGFSDGASYALSLGLGNGDLFAHVLAFSPGFAAPAAASGRPKIFISHGDDDRILPVARCGRPLARRLRDSGYDVDYREFKGGHVVPPEMLSAGFERFLGAAP